MAFDDAPDPPLVFADQIIEMLVGHLFGDSLEIDARECTIIRLAFRRLGGSWFDVCLGSPRNTDLLIGTVKAWGATKNR